MVDAHVVAWLACVFCIVFTLRCAFAFAQTEPDIFLALAVYAGQFAVLLVFYGKAPVRSDLLPAFSGYFAAIAGFLIVRRHHFKADGEVHQVRTSEEVVAWLLLLVALPHIIGNPFRPELLPHVTEDDVEVFVTVRSWTPLGITRSTARLPCRNGRSGAEGCSAYPCSFTGC